VSTRVLVASESSDAGGLASALGGDGTTVVRVETVAAARDRLADDGADCLVCALGGSEGATLINAVRDAGWAVPVVVYAPADPTLVRTAVDADVAAFLPRGEHTHADVRERVRATQDACPLSRPRDRKLLDAIFERVPVHLFVKDEAGRHIRVSEAAIDDPGRLVGKRDLDLDVVSEKHGERALADDLHVVQTGEPVIDQEEYLPHRDQWNLTSKVPWYDESGSVRGIIGVARDITERKRRQNQVRRQNERLEEFASVVSHDLRNPLSVARGHLDLAGDGEHVTAAEEAVVRMSEVIDDVLTLAQEGQTDVDAEPVELEGVVRKAWATAGDPAGDLQVADLPATVLADELRLRRLFENLFRNAVEHGSTSPDSDGEQNAADDAADPDPPTVTAGGIDDHPPATNDPTREERRVGFYVADDGPGVPADERERVFEPEYSSDDDGTGLGLPIVRSIADAHGWQVAVTDSEDGGARFEVTSVEQA